MQGYVTRHIDRAMAMCFTSSTSAKAWPTRCRASPRAPPRSHGWPSHCRSTPELDQLQAHLSALMPYRVAAEVMAQMFPVGGGNDPETLRCHTLKIGAALRDQSAVRPDAAAALITVSLDSTFIRSCQADERHLEVRVGNVETAAGGRQMFGAVAKADTDIKVLIHRSLDAVGRSEETVLTAFTDGCPGLQRILADAGVTETPVLDWFHIGMRLQHLEQTAGGLSADDPARAAGQPRDCLEIGGAGTEAVVSRLISDWR